MRVMVSTAAFLIPLLLIIAIAGTCSSPPPATVLDGPTLGELRTWVGNNLAILDHYAAKPGSAGSTSIPHLALERFDRRGCDEDGNPWFRLARRPSGIDCGVLRQTSATPAKPDAGAGPGRLIPLAGGWSYWERPLPLPQPRP